MLQFVSIFNQETCLVTKQKRAGFLPQPAPSHGLLTPIVVPTTNRGRKIGEETLMIWKTAMFPAIPPPTAALWECGLDGYLIDFAMLELDDFAHKKIGGKRLSLAATGIDFNRILLSA